MMSFTPRKQPLKEGRSYPGGLPYAGPSSRGLNRRQGGLLLIVIILIPLWFFFTTGSSLAGAPPPPDTRPQSNVRAPEKPPQVVVKDPTKPAAEPPVVADTESNQAPFRAPDESEDPALLRGEEPAHPEPKEASAGRSKGYGPAGVEEEAEDIPAPASPGSGRKQSPPSVEVAKWSERPQFEKALARVINMLPGEMHMRDLLRPVEGTGKERIREMGLRTRAYKSYFEAWEDLHLDTDAEGGTYVRDDVVQYMRSHVHDDAVSGAAIPGLESMDLAQQIRSYESYRYFLAKFGQMLFPWTAPYFSDHMSLHAHFKRGGRGIVLTAGDDQAPYLLTSIPMMRELGCKIPIEVMYLGDSDLSEDYRSDLEALDGVVTRDIAQMVNDEGWRLAGWAAKPFAILFSSFREVIFIDADSLFFKNPEVLFDEPSYKKTGALFFRDRLIMPENKKRFLQQILPKPISKQVKQSRFWSGDSGHQQESGVVVVDKWRHFMAMLMVTRMNGPDRDGNKDEGRIGVYDLMYGDKETFWLGWELVGDPEYAFHQGDAGIMGDLDRDAKAAKEAEEKKRQEEEQQRQQEEQRRKEEEAEANRAKDAQQPDPAGDSEADGDDNNSDDKQLRKRGDPGSEDESGSTEPGPKDDSPQTILDEPTITNNNEDDDNDNDNDDNPDTHRPTPRSEPQPQVQAQAGPPEPSSYTLCSPQLLHLDTDDTPLWFNGWLLDNKFADKRKKKFGTFRHYLIEPRDVREPGAWQLHENNECCLTADADKMHKFNDRELKLLDRMMGRAREVGAPGS